VVYTREVEGQELTFGTSGKLYKDALVMYDRQTRSLWTQVDGSVLQGEMKGAQLKPVSAVHTTWREWKRLHPHTVVLKKDRAVRGSPYADYFASPDRMGIAGTKNPDERLPGKELVVTVRVSDDALAVPVEALRRVAFHQTEVAGVPVVIVLNTGASDTPAAFDRRADGRVLDFELHVRGREVVLRDKQTGTQWSGLTGKAQRGELAGRQLRPVPHMVNYWFAWVAYNPRTRVEP
jgi:hypothetical protein